MGAPWLDPADECVWRRFLDMQVRLRSRLSRDLQQHTGLSEADYEVLVHLSESPGRCLRVFELAEATRWEKSRLSHHLTRMCGRGLVRRAGCPTDSRGTVVELTDVGWDSIVRAAPLHAGHVRQWFVEALTPAQRACLGEISAALSTHLATADDTDRAEPGATT
ncbi:MAG: MarR family winged helix-turn-helix transcriptional regulator [Actinomycetota bacterium]|jgi:DNA-binding MarR family transcriptional regulator|nr:MarR family winged helix-turn-helix transcriptional regulator [Actinomycetota bacterium]